MVHVVLVLLIEKATPLATLGCELIEGGLRGVAAGTALEVNGLA
jgi:hypothetical protein